MTHADVILQACRETSEFAQTNAPTPRSIWNTKGISTKQSNYSIDCFLVILQNQMKVHK